MCGIIGIVGKQSVSERILEGLRRLEYRGYDSAGIATLDKGNIVLARAKGKISNLEKLLKKSPLKGNIGIGHTRWATHGAPTSANAHPHATKHVAVVHNGIIENYLELKKQLKKQGCQFVTETDTEVIPHLIEHYLSKGHTPQKAVENALSRLEGAFALGILFEGKDILIAARKGSPLVIGYGEGEMVIGSDGATLGMLAKKLCYLEDGDMAVLTKTSATIFDSSGMKVTRPQVVVTRSHSSTGKEGFAHYMLKEIFEQPKAAAETLNAYFSAATGQFTLPPLYCKPAKLTRLMIVACGTSYYAGMVAKYWFERYAKINVDVDVASEFRYREAPLPKDCAAIFISQSGETADTLAALKHVKEQGIPTIAIVNVKESTMAREADGTLLIHAGPEIGVASTKAFTCQLMTLACLVMHFCHERHTVKDKALALVVHALAEIPSLMEEVLESAAAIKTIAAKVAKAKDVLYIGRGVAFPLALEGALKLKEISYIHAEGAAAGELKHGPIALIDKNMPVIAIAPPDSTLFEKTASNIQEVVARGGKVILLSDKQGVEKLKSLCFASFAVPNANALLAPLLYTLPVQLLAYYVAVFKGTDVDQPRNLAKSVTVE
jgi:glucosamine--fructose-6-phosphate aminotransferase (isomerizing)